MLNKFISILMGCLFGIPMCFSQIDSVFVCDVKFNNPAFNNPHAGSGFILKHKNTYYGITAKHVIHFAKTDSMESVSFNGELRSWEFRSKTNPKHAIKAGVLLNEDPNEKLAMPPKGDWLIFELTGEIPKNAAVYTLRNKPLKKGDLVSFLGHPYKSEGAIRIEGSFIGYTPDNNLSLDVPKGNYGGCSGGPVIDKDGKLVGIVSMGYFNEKENKMVFEPASLDYFRGVMKKVLSKT